jgi:hypothetical protein
VDWNDIAAAAVTLLFIMDPFNGIADFLASLPQPITPSYRTAGTH